MTVSYLSGMNCYDFIKSSYPKEKIIILEQWGEIINESANKTITEMVACEYRRQLLSVFSHLDHRIKELEDMDSMDYDKNKILLKELNRLKNRFNP